MNKFFRKLLVLILALTVAFAAVGCDSCNEEAANGGTAPSGPNTSILAPKTPEISLKATNDLIVGDSLYLSPTVKNVKGDLLWQSSNNSVVKVTQDGVATALNEGSADVTASYGGVTATTKINVTYGGLQPNISTYSGLDVLVNNTKNVLAVGSQYNIGARVDFNNKIVDTDIIQDPETISYEYETSNPDVLSVDANGVLTPNKYGENVVITIKAIWRTFTVVKSFSVDVRENVLFYNYGKILENLVVNTPAVFLSQQEMNNVITLDPSVKVGSELTEDNNVNVSFNAIGDVEYEFDSATKVYTAKTVGKSLATLSYDYNGNTYVANFLIEAVRPVKEITEPVQLYSAGAGTYKVKSGNTYLDKTLVEFAWGGESGVDPSQVVLYDAYQEGKSLDVNSAKQIVEDVAVNYDDFTDTSITIGSKSECYTIHLDDACSYYISNADDVIGALDKSNRTYSSVGLYILLNDVDMTGAPSIKNTNGFVNFQGVFEGNGFAIYNPVIEMKTKANLGMFGALQSGTKIKDLAIINVSSINNLLDDNTGRYENLLNNGWLTASFGNQTSSLVLENMYVQVSPNMHNNAGMLVRYRGTATNVIINEKSAPNFDIDSWFLDANNHYYGYGALSRISSEYSYTYDSFENATSKLSSVYVVSRKPVHYQQTKSSALLTESGFFSRFEPTFDLDKKVLDANDSITYAENETELWKVYDYFTDSTSAGGLDLNNPKVESVWKAINGQNTKVVVAKNLRRYDSFVGLAIDEAEKHVKNLENFKSSPSWVIANGSIPVWKSVYENPLLHDDYFGIVMGGMDATYGAVAKSYVEYDLSVNVLNKSLISNVVFSTNNSSIVTIENNKLKAKAVSGDATATVTANFIYNGVPKSMSFKVSVVDPFDVLINDEIVNNGVKLDIAKDYKFAISLDGQVVENVTYQSNANSVMALKSGSTDTFTALAVGNATITATFNFGGTAQTREFVLQVVDPIAERGVLLVDGAAVDGVVTINAHSSAVVSYSLDGVEFDASKITLTTINSSFVNISGNVVTVLKNVIGEEFTVNGILTENGNQYEFSFKAVVEAPEISEVTVNGSVVSEGTINVQMPGTATIGIRYNFVPVEQVSIAGYDGFATASGTTLTTVTHGSFNLTITFVLDSKTFVYVIPVAFAYPSKTIEDAIDYDASTGMLYTTRIEGDVFGATVGEERLTIANGGIIDNGDGSYYFRAKTSETDTKAGVPYMANREKVSNVFEFTIDSNVNTYVFTNVSYYTMLIDDVDSLKAALGNKVDYTAVEITDDIANVTKREKDYNGKGFKVVTAVDNSKYYENVYNVGIYKLIADINMNGAGIDYENNTLDGASLGGYAALLDGAGYSIKNFRPGTQGLLGSMNSYVRGSNTDTSYQTSSNDQLNRRSIPFTPTIKNIAFEDVITTIDTPVIAISAGYADAFVPRPPVIENIYVTISSDSTGSSGIIRNVNSHVKTNNVYVVNNNDFDNFITLDNKFEFTTRDGAVTAPSDGMYFNVFTTNAYKDSSLFGKIAGNNTNRTLNSVSYTTNVYVVSKLPLTANATTLNNYYGYCIIEDTENKLPKLTQTYLGGYASFTAGKNTRSSHSSYGFGANETVSRIPVVYAIKDNLVTEYNTYYDAGLAGSNKTWGLSGFFCPECGKVTIAKETNGVVNKDKGNCLMTENCTGKLVANADTVGSGFWGSPTAYVWTTVNLVTEAGTDFTMTNGNFRFESAYKYDTVDLMPQGEENYASFLGTAGNGMWGLDSNNRLVWVGAQRKI